MSLRRNTIANVLNTGVRFVVLAVTQPLLVRAMGLERFGAWTLLLSLSALASLAEVGLSGGTMVFIAEAKSRGDQRQLASTAAAGLLAITLLGILATGMWFSAGGSIIERLFEVSLSDADSQTGLMVLGVGLLPRLWQQWLVGLEAGLGRYDVMALAETVTQVTLNLGLLALALLQAPLFGLAAWHVSMTVVALMLHLALIRRAGERVSLGAIDRTRIAAVLRFSVLNWVTNIGSIIYTKADRLLIGATLGLDAVGLYSAATSIASKINEVGGVAVQPITPAMSAAKARGDAHELRRVFEWSLRLNGLIVYVLVTAVVWFAPLLATLMTKTRPSELADLMEVLAVAYAAFSVAATGGLSLLGLRRAHVNAVATLAAATLSIVLIRVFSTQFGLMGAAYGNFGYVVILGMNVVAARAVGFTMRQLVVTTAPFWLSLFVMLAIHRLVLSMGYPPVLVLLAAFVALIMAVWIDPRGIRQGLELVRGTLLRRQ